MFVTTANPATGESQTVVRGGHNCRARKNGSFIDLWVERNGERFFVGIPPADLLRMADLTDGQEIKVLVLYDEKV